MPSIETYFIENDDKPLEVTKSPSDTVKASELQNMVDIKNENNLEIETKIKNDEILLRQPIFEEYKLQNIQSASSIKTNYEMNNFQSLSKNALIRDYFTHLPNENSKCFNYNEYNGDIISDGNSSYCETLHQPPTTTNLNSLRSKMNLEQLEKDIEQRKQCESEFLLSRVMNYILYTLLHIL